MKHFVVLLISFSFIHDLLAQVDDISVAPVMEEVVFVEEESPKGVRTFVQNGLTGVKDYAKNTIIIPAEYNSITPVDASNFIVKKAALGVFNTALNKLVIPMEFEQISFLHRNERYQFNDSTRFVIIVKKAGQYSLMDQNYNYLMNDYDKMESTSRYIIIAKDAKSGIYFLDRRLKDIPMSYDKIDELYKTSNHFVASIGNNYFLFDPTGKLIRENCRQISVFRDLSQQRVDNKMLIVDANGKSGIYDTKNNTYLLRVQYESITDGFEDQFVVRKKSTYGVVGKDNKTVIPFDYDSLAFLFPRSPNTPLLAVRNNKSGLIDRNNKVIVKLQYDDIQSINGFYKAKKQEKYTVLDSLGKPITDLVFDNVGSVFNGEMAVFNNGKVGYLSTAGKLTTPIERTSLARGYNDVELLFKGFEKAIKADSDSVLMNFCRDVVFDGYTREFFLRIGYQYRGFPNKTKYTIEDAAKEYFRSVSRFYRRLKESGLTQSFTFERVKEPGFEYFDPSKMLRATETWGIYKSQDRTYTIKLGELIDCDGYWKSFTNFRTM